MTTHYQLEIRGGEREMGADALCPGDFERLEARIPPSIALAMRRQAA
jgi:hypothetical protein